MLNEKILITGVSGYIGGALAIRLSDAGYTIIGNDIIDPPEYIKSRLYKFVAGDYSSISHRILEESNTCIHCAATSLVGPSIKNPYPYYINNIVGNISFMMNLGFLGVPIIFSSSSSVYQNILKNKFPENGIIEPISPYGVSKMIGEEIIKSYHLPYTLNYTIFRYFNVCGALPEHGQEKDATHIFARLMNCVKNKKPFILNGTNYWTNDGTCVRDYVHIEYLCDIYLKALEIGIQNDTFNLGSGFGTSNLECIKEVESYFYTAIDIEKREAREGDMTILVADMQKTNLKFGVENIYTVNDIINSLHKWYGD